MEGISRPSYIDDLTTVSNISAYDREKHRVQNVDVGNRRQLFKRPTCSPIEKGRGSDDLVAMGTLWSPGINSSTNSRDSISGQTISISSNNSVINKSLALGPQNTNANNNVAPQRKNSTSNVRLNQNSGVNGLSTSMFGMQLSINSNNGIKDKFLSDPKYIDPLIGASASFQQRLMELASLEADTIRWERTKKVKKKAKQDRDS